MSRNSLVFFFTSAFRLKQWGKVARRLADSSLAIERDGESHFSRLAVTSACPQVSDGTACLRFTLENDDNATPPRPGDNYLELRLFYYAPLMDVLYSYFAKNIPGEFWIDHSEEESTTATATSSAATRQSSQRLSFLDDPSVRERLGEAVGAMGDVLRSLWLAMAANDAQADARLAKRFLWLAEEWLHAQRMLAPASGQAQLQLPTPATGSSAQAVRDQLLSVLTSNTITTKE
jgi:hypothetical protein